MNLFFVLRPAGVDNNDGRHHRSFVSIKKNEPGIKKLQIRLKTNLHECI